MDIFKRDLAPLSADSWKEIEKRAREVLLSRLTARKVVNVQGPKGLDFTSVNEGRLTLCDDGDVKAGVYTIKPLIEARVRFTLNRWEVDNLARGAKDIDFDSLDAAVDSLGRFEEEAIYNGYKAGGIQGLKEASTHKTLTFGNDGNAIMEALTKGTMNLQSSHINGPYSLIVGTKGWLALHQEGHGMPLVERVERMLGSKVIFAPVVEGAILVPYDSEDLEFTIGQDFAIGYESHDTKELTLFATESFTFRILEPKAIVCFQ